MSKVPLLKRHGKRGKYLSGSTYKKDGTKQAEPRYSYWDDFKIKMKQNETIVGEDLDTQFYQKIIGRVKD